MSHHDYQGKHVFVAGGTSGINLGIARAFANAGAKVAVMSRSQDKVDAAVAELKALGPDAFGIAADVRKYNDVAAGLAAAVEKFGEIDVMISGAAGNFPAPALGISSNGFKTVVDIDLNGTFNVMRACHQHLKQPGAAIVNISAPQAWHPTPFQVHVCAAKAGVDQVTRTLAMEWGPLGIRVNSIAPGPIAGTEGVERLAPSDMSKDMIAKSVPLGRMGEKSDIAKAALWLCSDEASYVSGVVLPVDGGWSLGGSGGMRMGGGA